MLKRKAELGASIAAHAQFEAELKERMAAFAKRKSRWSGTANDFEMTGGRTYTALMNV